MPYIILINSADIINLVFRQVAILNSETIRPEQTASYLGRDRFEIGETKTKFDLSFSAVDYHDFIDKKIDDIRKATDSASAPSYTVNGTSDVNKFKTVDVVL